MFTTFIIEIYRPPYPGEKPMDFANSSYSGGIIFNVDGVVITKKKNTNYKTSASDFLFAFLSKCMEAIPLLLKGKEVECQLSEEPSAFIFRPNLKTRSVQIKFTSRIGSFENIEKEDLKYEGEGSFYNVELREFIDQVIKASNDLCKMVIANNDSVKSEEWFLKFKKLISNTNVIYESLM